VTFHKIKAIHICYPKNLVHVSLAPDVILFVSSFHFGTFAY